MGPLNSVLGKRLSELKCDSQSVIVTNCCVSHTNKDVATDMLNEIRNGLHCVAGTLNHCEA